MPFSSLIWSMLFNSFQNIPRVVQPSLWTILKHLPHFQKETLNPLAVTPHFSHTNHNPLALANTIIDFLPCIFAHSRHFIEWELQHLWPLSLASLTPGRLLFVPHSLSGPLWGPGSGRQLETGSVPRIGFPLENTGPGTWSLWINECLGQLPAVRTGTCGGTGSSLPI